MASAAEELLPAAAPSTESDLPGCRAVGLIVIQRNNARGSKADQQTNKQYLF